MKAQAIGSVIESHQPHLDTVALQKIRLYRRSTKPLLQKLPFKRLVRTVVEEAVRACGTMRMRKKTIPKSARKRCPAEHAMK